MLITDLHLQTYSLAAMRAFYTTMLGLPLLHESTAAFTVGIGKTTLSFQATTQQEVVYHIAFTIPRNKFELAKSWLQRLSITMLAQNDQDEFSFESWNARALYFRDVSGNILEFIVHYALPNDTQGSFAAHDFLYISEIGLAVDNVPAQVTAFTTSLGLEPYHGFSEMFTAVGDTQGLFIVVKKGRPWFPTLTRSLVAPLNVTITGVQELHPLLIPAPYALHIAPLPEGQK